MLVLRCNDPSILVSKWISGKFKQSPQVWSVLGIASSTVGLVCYALSSSFKQLYGEWNLLKLILYAVVSLIIFCIVLFPEKFQVYRIPGPKTHVVILVLMLTSLCSVFYYKKVNGEADALSVISNAAITLTAVCLSKRIGHKYEVGVSTFFLGCLMIQLTRINLILTGVAVAYGYIVFALHSHDPSEDPLHIGMGTIEEGATEGYHVVDFEEPLATKQEAELQPLINRTAESNELVTLEPITKKREFIPFQEKATTWLPPDRTGFEMEQESEPQPSINPSKRVGVQIDPMNAVRRGDDIEINIEKEVAREGADVEMDTVKGVAVVGGGAESVSEEADDTGTSEKTEQQLATTSEAKSSFKGKNADLLALMSAGLKKLVLKVEILDDRVKRRIKKTASRISGVESVYVDMGHKQLTLTGDMDPVDAVLELRKLCHTEILSVEPAKVQEKEEPKKPQDYNATPFEKAEQQLSNIRNAKSSFMGKNADLLPPKRGQVKSLRRRGENVEINTTKEVAGEGFESFSEESYNTETSEKAEQQLSTNRNAKSSFVGQNADLLLPKRGQVKSRKRRGDNIEINTAKEVAGEGSESFSEESYNTETSEKAEQQLSTNRNAKYSFMGKNADLLLPKRGQVKSRRRRGGNIEINTAKEVTGEGLESLSEESYNTGTSEKGDEPHTHQTVDGLLQSLGLGKYSILFQAEEVDMTALKQMGDRDLKDLGIPMGPRKKILLLLQPQS